MKRFLTLAFSLLFLIIAAGVVIPSFIDWSAYKDQAAQVVREKTGLDMDIKGSFGFSIIPTPRFYIEKAALSTADKSNFASFERLEVNLELAPLLHKQVKVSSLTLVKPQITLVKLKTGKLNIMTPEIEALSNGEGATEKDNTKSQAIAQTPAFDISLDKIRIQEGVFVYEDQQVETKTMIQNINMELRAQSLAGPFDAQGSVFYEGHALNIDAKIGRYDSENKLILPKIKLVLQPGDITIDYDGVVSLEGEGGISLQGQTKIHMDDIAKTLSGFNIEPQQAGIKSGAFDAKGLLTADAKAMSYKNIALSLNNQALEANVTVNLSPFSYDLVLNTPKDSEVDLAALIAKSYGFKKANVDINATGDAKTTTIKSASINLDETNVSISGSYSVPKNARPQLLLNTKMTKLDYDKLTEKILKSPDSNSNSQGKNSAQQSSSSGVYLPIDINLTASVDEMVWNKKTLKGIETKVKLAQNSVIIESLTVQDIGKAKLKASGEVKDISTLSGITAYLDLDSSDIKALSEWLDVDTSAWPKKLNKANVKVEASGSKQGIDITTNITSMDAKLIASGKITDPTNNPTINNLEVQIKHNNMAQAVQLLSGAEVKDENMQKPLDFYAKVSQKGLVYTLENIKGDLSGITVEGEAKLDLSAKIPDIKATIAFGTLTLQSVVNKNASVTAVANRGAEPSSGSQKWSKQTINTSAFHAANLDIDISAKAINYGAWPLGEPQMTLKLRNGILDISDLSASVFGGQVSTSLKVQTANEARSPLYFESANAFKDVDLGKLSKALIGTKLVDISGVGSLDLKLKSSGVSPAALIYDLNGDGKVVGSDIILDGVDVAKFVRALSDDTKPGDTLVGIWKGSTKGGKTQFDTLNGAFSIQNGVVNISSMTLDGETARVETTGQIDLPRWTLSTKHPMSVKSTGNDGTEVPPFEISFNGSLDNPTQTFGQGLLQDYLQRKLQRKLNQLITDKLGLPDASNNNDSGTVSGSSGTENSTSNGASQETGTKSNLNPTPEPAPSQNNEDVLKGVAEDALKGVLQDLLR
jgi:uncharacterized protein involved in outer membrane biogenesis